MFELFKPKPKTAIQKPKDGRPKSTLSVSKNYSLNLSSYDSTGLRMAILASSGMGKSYLLGVLMEQFLMCNVPLCVIDPEGETFTLKERFPSVVVIGGDNKDLAYDDDDVPGHVYNMLTKGVSLIWDLSDHSGDDERRAYALIGECLFDEAMKRKRTCCFVVEEAQTFAPQIAGRDFKESLEVSQKISKRGRKHGIYSIWATQRPASLNKDVLSQCGDFWFGGIKTDQDYKAIKSSLEIAGVTEQAVKSLEKGNFFHYNGGHCTLLSVGERLCTHGGSTPQTNTNRAVADASAVYGFNRTYIKKETVPRKPKSTAVPKKKTTTILQKVVNALKGKR